MRVTRDDADEVAARLRSATPQIRSVLLFGSILRDGSGNDADFVLIVDDAIARQWWTEMGEELRVRMGTRWLPLRRLIKRFVPWIDHVSIRGRKHRRIKRASELIGVDIERLVEEYKPGMAIDIFLFPEEWRSGSIPNIPFLRTFADVIRDHDETRMFLERVARGAVEVA